MALKWILLSRPPKSWDCRYQVLLDWAASLSTDGVCYLMISDFSDPCVCQLSISQVFFIRWPTLGWMCIWLSQS